MPHHSNPRAAVAPDAWLLLGADGSEAAGSASSPLSAAAFFGGWVAVGVVLALGLAGRGHDRKPMVAIGAGLGPLMMLVGCDTVRYRERAAAPLVVRPRADLGGGLHVLVLVGRQPPETQTLMAAVEALRPDIATLAVARAVTYESIEGDVALEAVDKIAEPLRLVAEILAVEGAGIELHPGTTRTIVARFEERVHRALVLFAVDDESPAHAPSQDRQ